MKLIVGLGNPGMQYEETKHNVGFKAVDDFAFKNACVFNKVKFEAVYFETMMNGEKIVVIKPQTFMNLSGRSVAGFANFYKIPVEDIVVLYDDMDLALGRVRLRVKGGAGGHNGIKSIINSIGSQNFNRIKIGIGRPYPDQAVTSHVLSPFEKDQREAAQAGIYLASDALDYYLAGNTFENTMNKFN